MLDALSRGLSPEILWQGYGTEHRDVVVSYQCQSPVLGLVLPSQLTWRPHTLASCYRAWRWLIAQARRPRTVDTHTEWLQP